MQPDHYFTAEPASDGELQPRAVRLAGQDVEIVTAGGIFWRYHWPSDARRGMATRTEAAQVLGRSRLRAARTIIRPDLYGTTRGRPR